MVLYVINCCFFFFWDYTRSIPIVNCSNLVHDHYYPARPLKLPKGFPKSIIFKSLMAECRIFTNY